MTKGQMAGLVTLVVFVTGVGCSPVRKAEPVTLAQLASDAVRYDRRIVQVKGYVWFGYENDALCTSLDDVSTCIDLERSGLLKRHRRSYFRDFDRRKATFAAQFIMMPPPEPDSPCVVAGDCIRVGVHTPYALRLVSPMEVAE
jgi:hypothetical protein